MTERVGRGGSSVASTTVRRGLVRQRRKGWGYLLFVAACFILGALSFIGSGAVANRQLERVTWLTHDVSENAMPSLAQVGSLLFEMAALGQSLDEAAEGVPEELGGAEAHLQEVDQAWGRYRALPQFAGEAGEAAHARLLLDGASRAAAEVVAAVRAGDFAKAEATYAQSYVPVAAMAEASLWELRRINLNAGTAAGRQADEAMAHARSVAIALDVACAIFTASLAALAVMLLRRAMNAESRRADELDAFAARVAHDLRGPLSAPLMTLQRLAKEGAVDADQRSVVEKGVRSLKRADSLIGDLLLFARAAAAPEPGVCSSLTEAVSGALSDVESEAAAAKVHVEVAHIPGRSVCCAPGVLSSILENLIRNAVKHMPAGCEPRVVYVRAEERLDSVKIEVADTGSGIPMELQRTIFEPYVRANSSRPGLGLGLATVQRLVQAHGGKVGVRSRVGKGSTFWFELPAWAA